jgi:hypothetical protein
MKPIIPMLSTATGALLGSLYGYLSMLATIPALIASDIPVPDRFADVYQSRYVFILLPIVLILGGGIGKWRTAQIEELVGWRRWIALILLGLIVAVLGYAASIALFCIALFFIAV